MPRGERLYRALAIVVVGTFTAAAAALIAAIALISRRSAAGVLNPEPVEGSRESDDVQNARRVATSRPLRRAERKRQ